MYLDLDITSQLCSNIPMPMQESVMYVKGVVENWQNRWDHYNLLLFKSCLKSGIDVIMEINLNSSLQHQYILMDTNYFT